MYASYNLFGSVLGRAGRSCRHAHGDGELVQRPEVPLPPCHPSSPKGDGPTKTPAGVSDDPLAVGEGSAGFGCLLPTGDADRQKQQLHDCGGFQSKMSCMGLDKRSLQGCCCTLLYFVLL